MTTIRPTLRTIVLSSVRLTPLGISDLAPTAPGTACPYARSTPSIEESDANRLKIHTPISARFFLLPLPHPAHVSRVSKSRTRRSPFSADFSFLFSFTCRLLYQLSIDTQKRRTLSESQRDKRIASSAHSAFTGVTDDRSGAAAPAIEKRHLSIVSCI